MESRLPRSSLSCILLNILLASFISASPHQVKRATPDCTGSANASYTSKASSTYSLASSKGYHLSDHECEATATTTITLPNQTITITITATPDVSGPSHCPASSSGGQVITVTQTLSSCMVPQTCSNIPSSRTCSAATTLTVTEASTTLTLTEAATTLTLTEASTTFTFTEASTTLTVTQSSISTTTLVGPEVTTTITLPGTTSTSTVTTTITSENPIATELIVNGGFQSGVFAPWNVQINDEYTRVRILQKDGIAYKRYLDIEQFAVGNPEPEPDPTLIPPVVSQTVNLVAGTQYTFSCWMDLNVIGGIGQCRVNALVDGNVVATRTAVRLPNGEDVTDPLQYTSTWTETVGGAVDVAFTLICDSPIWAWAEIDDVKLEVQSV